MNCKYNWYLKSFCQDGMRFCILAFYKELKFWLD